MSPFIFALLTRRFACVKPFIIFAAWMARSDGEEFAATLMCSTGNCLVCDCPKDALDRTDVFYPLRNIERVKAAVYEAREELLEEDKTVKRGNKTKV
jgi:hypothetical protein